MSATRPFTRHRYVPSIITYASCIYASQIVVLILRLKAESDTYVYIYTSPCEFETPTAMDARARMCLFISTYLVCLSLRVRR